MMKFYPFLAPCVPSVALHDPLLESTLESM